MYNWKNNFDVASEIIAYVDSNDLDKNMEEAYSRTAISKLYYGCFHLVTEKNELYGLKPVKTGSDSHENAIDRIHEYANQVSPSEKSKMTRDIRILKEYRTKADYKSQQFYGLDMANNVSKLAHKIYESLKEY